LAEFKFTIWKLDEFCVVSTKPTDKENNVDTGSVVEVCFSDDVDPATVNENTFIVEEKGLNIINRIPVPNSLVGRDTPIEVTFNNAIDPTSILNDEMYVEDV